MLINPKQHIVIRECPLNKGYIACDQLKSNLRFDKELGSLQEDNLDVAFARFANNDIIKPVGFFVSDTLTFNLTEYYWGNER